MLLYVSFSDVKLFQAWFISRYIVLISLYWHFYHFSYLKIVQYFGTFHVIETKKYHMPIISPKYFHYTIEWTCFILEFSPYPYIMHKDLINNWLPSGTNLLCYIPLIGVINRYTITSFIWSDINFKKTRYKCFSSPLEF